MLGEVFGTVDADEHDDEQEQCHDRTGIDHHLYDGDKMGKVHDVENSERQQREDQAHRRLDRVLREHHRQRADQNEGTEQEEENQLGHASSPDCPFSGSRALPALGVQATTPSYATLPAGAVARIHPSPSVSSS
ncbi:hypothetical protein BMS3Bbin01_01548 [bacterium BMS3Bbin01]|nr:hypothetical protein BMS3Bbin01_01548 [bacterium BMS3Bbin01]